MNKKQILPISFYEFDAPETLAKDLLDYVTNLTYTKNVYNKTMNSQVESFNFPSFTDWVHKCLEKVKQEEYGDVNWQLYITQIWTNKSNYGEFHHKHLHPNSIVSGIFYLNDFEKGGGTKFFHPNPYYKVELSEVLNLSSKKRQHELIDTVQTKFGKLVIFPSSINHTTVPHTSVDTRYTVAFNTFIKGVIGKTEEASYLQL